MKRIDLGNLLAAANNVALFADKIAVMIEPLGAFGMADIRGDRIGLLVRSINKMIAIAENLELPATASAARACQSNLGRLGAGGGVLIGKELGRAIVSDCHQITTSLSAELERHHAYVVAPREGRLIDDGPAAFGQEVLDAFPEVRQDISAAARSRAYELWTACVMHLMRVAEVGIGRLADHVGAARGNSWGATAASLAKALESSRGSGGDPAAKQWLAEAATYLNFVKNGFRNPAMHPDKVFDREEAVAIYDNTRSLMRLLARRLRP